MMTWAQEVMLKHDTFEGKKVVEDDIYLKIEESNILGTILTQVSMSEGDCLTIHEGGSHVDIPIDNMIYILKYFTTPELLRMIADKMENDK